MTADFGALEGEARGRHPSREGIQRQTPKPSLLVLWGADLQRAGSAKMFAASTAACRKEQQGSSPKHFCQALLKQSLLHLHSCAPHHLKKSCIRNFNPCVNFHGAFLTRQVFPKRCGHLDGKALVPVAAAPEPMDQKSCPRPRKNSKPDLLAVSSS